MNKSIPEMERKSSKGLNDFPKELYAKGEHQG
jgi:hypothetical protein